MSQEYHPSVVTIEKHKDLQHKNLCHFQFVVIPSSSSSNKPCFRKISSNHHIDTLSRLSANEPRFFCHYFYPRAHRVRAHQRNSARHTHFQPKNTYLFHQLCFQVWWVICSWISFSLLHFNCLHDLQWNEARIKISLHYQFVSFFIFSKIWWFPFRPSTLQEILQQQPCIFLILN